MVPLHPSGWDRRRPGDRTSVPGCERCCIGTIPATGNDSEGTVARPSRWQQASPPAQSIRRRVIRVHAFAFALLLGLLVPLVVQMFGDDGLLVPLVVLGVVGIVLAVGLARLTWVTLDRVVELDVERTGLRQAYDRARLDALRDGLTSLGNHRAFQEELDEQIVIAREDEEPLTLV